MSTSKHIDKICIAAISLTLALTILFMCEGTFGITVTAKTLKYESTLFDTSCVHKIDIVVDDWESFIETCESEEYSACTVVIDGNSHKNTAIRAKGNTSLSSVSSMGSQRYSFKLEFDHYEDGKSCDGLDKLCLNNLIQDNTMMKDYIAYTLMNDFGVDSPLCSFAYITVNGEDWGLYLAVEGVEDSFLARNYGSDAGELYKPDSMSLGGGRGNGKDFEMGDFDFNEDGGGFGGFDFGSFGKKNDTGTDSEQSEDSTPQMPDSSGGQDGLPQMPGNGEIPGVGQMPQGGFDGEMPDFGGGEFEMPSMPGSFGEGDAPQDGNFEMPEGFTPGETIPGNTGSDSQTAKITAAEAFPQENFGGMGGPREMNGMGSEDVKLQYIDDNPDSYPNIFDNAKTDVTEADENRLISALKDLSDYTNLEDTLDTDEVLRYFVVHNFVVNGDSYTGNMIHNYYLHEKDGRLGMIPWDYNLAFGTFQGGSASGSVNDSVDEVLSDRPMQAWIFSDESYTEKYHTLYAEFIEKWFSDGELEKLIADTAELIRPYMEKDPTKFCTEDEFDAGVQAMAQFVTLRAEAVSRQLAGDNTAVDTGTLNLSDMGSMGGGFGGGMPGGGGNTGNLNGGAERQNNTATSDSQTEGNGSMGNNGGFSEFSFNQGGGSDFGGNTDFTDIPAPGNPNGVSDAGKWGLVGISVIVLAVGLLIAVKKKY